MFCPECGKKNEKGAKFCEHCGAKMEDNTSNAKPTSKEKKPINKKSMSKKCKIILGIVIVLAILLIIFFCVFGSKYKPSKIAEEYFVALMNEDTDKLYQYLDVSNKDFTTKKIFKKVYDVEDEEILNYSVQSETKSADGLSTTVTINYTLKGDSKVSTENIYLVKEKGKKLLFFDNWQISDRNSMVVEDAEFRAPKGSTITIEGIKVDKKYLKNSSSSSYDNYVIPQMFVGDYDITVNLKNGIILKDDVKISGSGTTNLTNLEVDESIEKNLEKSLPNIIDTLYKSAIDKKSFDDIKENYKYGEADLDGFKNAYEDFSDYISDSLTKFTVKEVDIEKTNITSDGLLYVTADVEYEYTLDYEFSGEKQTKTKESSDIMYFTLDYVKNEFKLVDMSSMATYFSRY